MQFPSDKVLMWERFDFTKGRRTESRYANYMPIAGVRQADAYPTWNNPGAEPSVGTVDGSVRRVKMTRLYELSQSTRAAEARAFQPSGDWTLPDTTLRNYVMDKDGLENGGTVNTGRYPAWFWATRDGIRGRDLPPGGTGT